MTSHEIGCLNLISAADRRVAEAQVRACEAATLLGVVREVSLTILVGIVTDNLHTVLIGTNGTVGTQTEEFGLEDSLAAKCHLLLSRQRGEGEVVNDTYGEVVLRLWQLEVLIDAEHHGGSHVGRTEAVTSAYDDGSIGLAIESVTYIKQERFAVRTGFLCAVEHSDTLAGLWNCSQQVLHAERTIEMNADHTILLAVGVSIVDSLAGSL